MDNGTFQWNNWADIIEATPGTEVWAKYDDMFYKGMAAVLTRKQGKGTVTYIGPDTDDGKLETEVLKKVYGRAGIETMNLPEGVVVGWASGFWMGMNYLSQNQTIPVPANAKVLIGQKRAETCGSGYLEGIDCRVG